MNPLASLKLQSVLGIDSVSLGFDGLAEFEKLGIELGNDVPHFLLGEVFDVFHCGSSVMPNGFGVKGYFQNILGGILGVKKS
jgi:hypothetical protein